MRFLLLSGIAVAALACGGRAQQPALIQETPGGLAALPGDGDRAYISEQRGLVEIDPTGASQVVRIPPIRWCATDARARVVWFVSGLGLEVFDLDDRKMYPIALGDLAGIGVAIDHDGEHIDPDGNAPVILRVGVADTPALHVEDGCGDPTFTCYDDQGRASPQLVAYRERAGALRIEDSTYVASLAARGAAGTIWARSEPPVLPYHSDGGVVRACGWASGRWR